MILLGFFLGQIAVAALVVFLLKGKLDDILIESAVRQLEILSSEKKSSVKVITAVTSKNLSSANQERLKKAIVKQFGEAAMLSLQIDQSLLGGIIIKLGSDLIDCSLRTRLRQARGLAK